MYALCINHERRNKMATQKKATMDKVKRKPALTPESREKQLIAMATDLAAQQLADGSASSQVITHFLKAGSERERIERERLKTENDLLKAKIEALQSAKHTEELFANAIEAMKRYSGAGSNHD